MFASSWRQRRLPAIVAELMGRPGHDNTRALIQEVLTNGLSIESSLIDHEVRLEAVHGRADMLFGATVIEFKRNLTREMPDVHARLPDYLRERQRALSGRRFLGIATDGALFIAYELREPGLADARPGPADMAEVGRHAVAKDGGPALLAWLESALSDRDDLPPEPLTVSRELGRDSLTFGRAGAQLGRLWARLRDHPEVALKRQLWDGLLRVAYGAPPIRPEDAARADTMAPAPDPGDSLFLQHTYLTIVAKTIAARVLGVRLDDLDATTLLSGARLQADGIHGAVESDFFDWVLQDPEGHDLVLRLARQAGRFDLRRAEADVLKALYESLIDRRDRHGLGEYYTPDWLAARLTARAVTDPLTQRVLDPACGSGTFLFHAIRHLRTAAGRAGWDAARIVDAAARQIRGIDIHPVAVILARVTWLLALGEDVRGRQGDLHVPVFLGDAMQWARRRTVTRDDFEVEVPGERPLRIPGGLAEDQQRFDASITTLADGLAQQETREVVQRRFARVEGVDAQDAEAMGGTYARVLALKRAQRNGIWPYMLRNLSRPLWLSRADQRADVVLGNPPWVAYRHLSPEMQARVKEASERYRLWVGGKMATQQDLSAVFWARCAERYLKPHGTIAFVLPRSAMTGPVFGGLRAADLRDVQVRVTEGWSLDNKRDVSPLFPVPACVLIGRRDASGRHPARIARPQGRLPTRDATQAQAERVVRWEEEDWPRIRTLTAASPYRARFKDGASLFPRRFVLVTRDTPGRLGVNRAAPRVTGRETTMDKPPWNAVTPPSGNVEIAFQRPVLLGEGIAPFRLLPKEVIGVIPLDVAGELLDSVGANAAGHRFLRDWLRDCEAKWAADAKKKRDGTPKLTLIERLDYHGGLSAQAQPGLIRVAHSKAGVLMAAAILEDTRAIVDHMAYWSNARSMAEARYLCAILNSEEARGRIKDLQSRGEGGARHFDNLMWELPIPEFSNADALHRELAAAAERAERIAASVPLEDGWHFTRQRRAIRDALTASALAAEIDALVARLLDGVE